MHACRLRFRLYCASVAEWSHLLTTTVRQWHSEANDQFYNDNVTWYANGALILWDENYKRVHQRAVSGRRGHDPQKFVRMTHSDVKLPVQSQFGWFEWLIWFSKIFSKAPLFGIICHSPSAELAGLLTEYETNKTRDGVRRTVLDLEDSSRTKIVALALALTSKRSGLGLDAWASSHL